MITDRASARDITAADVRELVDTKALEENALEFKETADSDLLKVACGIANFGGGFIVIGMEEDSAHRASGLKHVPNSQSEADSIRQRLRDGISPRPGFRSRRVAD